MRWRGEHFVSTPLASDEVDVERDRIRPTMVGRKLVSASITLVSAARMGRFRLRRASKGQRIS